MCFSLFCKVHDSHSGAYAARNGTFIPVCLFLPISLLAGLIACGRIGNEEYATTWHSIESIKPLQLGQDEQGTDRNSAIRKCKNIAGIPDGGVVDGGATDYGAIEACVHMMLGEFYERQGPLTIPGTLIGYGDNNSIMNMPPLLSEFPYCKDLSLEAIWGPTGALCVEHLRWNMLSPDTRLSTLPMTPPKCSIAPSTPTAPWAGNPFPSGSSAKWVSYSLGADAELRLASCPSCSGAENNIYVSTDTLHAGIDVSVGSPIGFVLKKSPKIKNSLSGCTDDGNYAELNLWRWCFPGLTTGWLRCDYIATTGTVDAGYSSITRDRTYIKTERLGYISRIPQPGMIPLLVIIDNKLRQHRILQEKPPCSGYEVLKTVGYAYAIGKSNSSNLLCSAPWR